MRFYTSTQFSHVNFLRAGERARISSAGGYVEFGRVNGSVYSRSLFLAIIGLKDHYQATLRYHAL